MFDPSMLPQMPDQTGGLPPSMNPQQRNQMIARMLMGMGNQAPNARQNPLFSALNGVGNGMGMMMMQPGLGTNPQQSTGNYMMAQNSAPIMGG